MIFFIKGNNLACLYSLYSYGYCVDLVYIEDPYQLNNNDTMKIDGLRLWIHRGIDGDWQSTLYKGIDRLKEIWRDRKIDVVRLWIHRGIDRDWQSTLYIGIDRLKEI